MRLLLVVSVQLMNVRVMAFSKIKRTLVLSFVMFSPFVFILTVIFVSGTWLNPIKSYQHQIGTITHAYAGCRRYKTCDFKALLENGKQTQVQQSFDEERLQIGDVVCVRINVFKSIDLRHGHLADMRECGK
ncbi:MAG: hypothetical protein H7173_08435 [Rhodoferax sp.]|nr:hypothetical protein [Pseudorhodobacter sp.]